MGMNVKKTKVIRTSWQQSLPVRNMIDQKQLENVEYFSYLGRMTINGKRRTHEIQSRIAMAKTAFNKQNLFSGKLDSNLRNKLVKCLTWSTALYTAQT
jgi:hypothetical protein